ncbi:phosphatidylserine decarboxylase family protein [Ceratobasidium sp. AG-Ba]|nr:phosphatidylserine decarboxylase family protein [Ceratobasidium sp. AG-Ba]
MSDDVNSCVLTLELAHRGIKLQNTRTGQLLPRLHLYLINPCSSLETMAVTDIVNKVRGALHRSNSASSSSSSDEEPSTEKEQAKERHNKLAKTLRSFVDNSDEATKPGAESGTIQHSAIAPASQASKHEWFRAFYSENELDSLFASEHMGNYVINRATGEKFFEDMPIYVRIGMHLLFNQSYISTQQTLLGEKRIDNLLQEQSVRQGQIYDRADPETFNEFFARKLKPEARSIAAPGDPHIITSLADCRLTVWNNIATATKIWVKGKHFTIPELLGDTSLAESKFGTNPSLAIFRLAPADYHRFHSPCAGVFASPKSIPGKYYTVNPQAVNTTLDVFTANRRDVRILESDIPSASGLTVPVAIVAIGAMLVGSVNWSNPAEGTKVAKGEDIGWFQYGGSTVIAVFPGDRIKWDDDLVSASEQGTEVMVRVGERIGQTVGPTA